MSERVPWLQILTEATLRVQEETSALAGSGRRSVSLGMGASGDRTLLADKRAEDALIQPLSRIGGLRIISEEAGQVGKEEGGLTAVIDPLDGSSNYERDIPFYCTSVAIADGGDLAGVFFGLIRNLTNGDVYAAARGGGATKNGKAIRTSDVRTPSESVVGIDMSRTTAGDVEGLAQLVAGVKRQVHYGANALELCYLAEGRIDAFVDLRGKARVVDVAAASLIAREAGASVSGPEGKPLDVGLDLGARFGLVASANDALHTRILELCGGRSR